jgi:DNA-binding FadR family transcriptional regulator
MHERAEKGETFLEEDREFHRCLHRGTNNRTLLKLLDIFWLTFQTASQYADIKDNEPMDTYRHHLAVLEAVQARDVERSVAALNQHYFGLESRLARVRQK